ncbi:MAG: ATP-binding protein, partial [Desulfobacterales bacterium]|nr:ATP-binding protein [Desulfobacterales bacterium]
EKSFEIKASPIIYAPLELGLAMPLTRENAFVDQLDMHLKAMKDDTDSGYPHILDKYLFGIPEPGWRANIRYLAVIFGAALVLILVMAAWSISLKMTVNRRTRELAQSNDKLAESNRLLNAVMETTTDAIFIKDLSGKYILANSATCAALGKPLGEVIGKNDAQLFPAASAEIISEADARVLKQGQNILSEEKLETAYGEETFWLANKTPYRDENGEVIGLIGISSNITEIKKSRMEKERLQNELRQAHKMEAIGTLAGGVAHDFNNILGIILGNSELAMEDLPEGHSAGDNLAEIKTASKRARDVVRQLLSFSRKGPKAKDVVYVQSILKECIKLLRASLPSTVEFVIAIDNDTKPIQADPTQIHQVIINLCTNAAHAMETSGGTLGITLKNTPGPDKIHPYVCLMVSDTGTGIAPEIQDRIFEPYFTTKDVGRGTGIGLSVVHGIIQSHGGTIELESAPGEGTLMTVQFPSSEGEQEAAGMASGGVIPGRGIILLVDDEISVVRMGTAMLERLGYRVAGMTDPEAALELFSENTDMFDLIITDLTMPKLTGEQLANRAKTVRPDIPVILSTGFSSKVENRTINHTHMDGVLEKPFDKRTLSQRVSEVLAGKTETT